MTPTIWVIPTAFIVLVTRRGAPPAEFAREYGQISSRDLPLSSESEYSGSHIYNHRNSMLLCSVDLNLFSEISIHFSGRDPPPNGWIVW